MYQDEVQQVLNYELAARDLRILYWMRLEDGEVLKLVLGDLPRITQTHFVKFSLDLIKTKSEFPEHSLDGHFDA